MSEPTQTAQPTAVQRIRQALETLQAIACTPREGEIPEGDHYHTRCERNPGAAYAALDGSILQARAAVDLNPLTAAQGMERVVTALENLQRFAQGHSVTAYEKADREARAALDAVRQDGAG